MERHSLRGGAHATPPTHTCGLHPKASLIGLAGGATEFRPQNLKSPKKSDTEPHSLEKPRNLHNINRNNGIDTSGIPTSQPVSHFTITERSRFCHSGNIAGGLGYLEVPRALTSFSSVDTTPPQTGPELSRPPAAHCDCSTSRNEERPRNAVTAVLSCQA